MTANTNLDVDFSLSTSLSLNDENPCLLESPTLELGEYASHNLSDAVVSTHPSFPNEILYHNTTLSQITSAFSPQCSLLASVPDATLEETVTTSSSLQSESIIPQEFDFPNSTSFSDVVCKDASYVSPDITTPLSSQVAVSSMLPTLSGSQNSQRMPNAVPASGISYVQQSARTNVPSSAPGSMFMLRVPLPTAVTKGLRVHLVATGQGTLPTFNDGTPACSANNMMLLRDRATGKDFLVPTCAPAVTPCLQHDLQAGTEITNLEDKASDDILGCHVSNFATSTTECQQINVNDFLNSPCTKSQHMSDFPTVDKQKECIPTGIKPTTVSGDADDSLDSDTQSKLVIDENPYIEEVRSSPGGVSPDTVTDEVHENDVSGEKGQVSAEENAELDLNTAKTGEELLIMMCRMKKRSQQLTVSAEANQISTACDTEGISVNAKLLAPTRTTLNCNDVEGSIGAADADMEEYICEDLEENTGVPSADMEEDTATLSNDQREDTQLSNALITEETRLSLPPVNTDFSDLNRSANVQQSLDSDSVQQDAVQQHTAAPSDIEITCTGDRNLPMNSQSQSISTEHLKQPLKYSFLSNAQPHCSLNTKISKLVCSNSTFQVNTEEEKGVKCDEVTNMSTSSCQPDADQTKNLVSSHALSPANPVHVQTCPTSTDKAYVESTLDFCHDRRKRHTTTRDSQEETSVYLSSWKPAFVTNKTSTDSCISNTIISTPSTTTRLDTTVATEQNVFPQTHVEVPTSGNSFTELKPTDLSQHSVVASEKAVFDANIDVRLNTPAQNEPTTDGELVRQQNELTTDGELVRQQNEPTTDGELVRQQNEPTTDGELVRQQNEPTTDGELVRQQIGGDIMQTEERIANLVPDSMKDFVRDIFEDEDALDKDSIRKIMQDTTGEHKFNLSDAPAVILKSEKPKIMTTSQNVRRPTKMTTRSATGKTSVARSFASRVTDTQCEQRVDVAKRWKCDFCPKIYTTKHNLSLHCMEHSDTIEKPHACVECGKTFKQVAHLSTHMLSHRKVKPFSCDKCDKTFTQRCHLKRHSTQHMDKKPHVCDVCQRGFAFPSELRHHKAKHSQDDDQMLSCSTCGQSFTTPKALKLHQNNAHGAKKMACSECDKKFDFPSQLRDHMMKHSGKRPFICGECGMDFMKEHHLKSHEFTHTGLRPFQCKLCDKSFSQKANLQRHSLIHQGSTYKCEICDRAFSQPQVLKSHMQIHSTEKPFECTECGKQFSRKHNLNGHMALHTGAKKYVCFCGAAFTLKGNLNRHRNTKHGLSDASLLVTDDQAAEAAAKILNEMSAKRLQYRPEFSPHVGEFTHSLADSNVAMVPWPADVNTDTSDLAPKKKRKSVPRKTKKESENNSAVFDSQQTDSTELARLSAQADHLIQQQRQMLRFSESSRLSESDDSNLSPAKPSSTRRKKKQVAKAQAEVEQDDVEKEWQQLAADGSLTSEQLPLPQQQQHHVITSTHEQSSTAHAHQLSTVLSELRRLKDAGVEQHETEHVMTSHRQALDVYEMEVDEHGRPKDLVTILHL